MPQKTLREILLFVIATIFIVELLFIPLSIYANHKCSEIINLTECLKNDGIAIVVTYIIGLIIYESGKPKNLNKRKKHEN